MHSRLQTYLDEVAAHIGPLPAKAQADELREMHGHLEAAFVAGLRRGRPTEEAARDVRAQFGAPDEVGASTVTAWRRGRSLERRRGWGAAACTLFLHYVLWCLLVLAGSADSGQFRQGTAAGPSHGWVSGMTLSLSLLVPLLKGSVVGLLFPKLGRVQLGFAVGASCVLSGLLTGFLLTTLLDVPISVFSAWAARGWRRGRAERARLARG